MKKTLLALTLIAAMAVPAFAEDGFALGIWFDYPKEVTNKNVGGVAIGLPIVSMSDLNGLGLGLFGIKSAKTSGLECSLIFNYARSLSGAQTSLFNIHKGQHGDAAVQVGVYNQSAKNGVQIGLVNLASDNASFQLGIVNINTNGWVPIMVLCNFGKHAFD